jgi:Heterokaryon incompatibility protein Het-C
MRLRRTLVPLVLLGLCAAPAAHAFSIDTKATLIPGVNPHEDDGGRHEQITADAIRRVTKNPSPKMILLVQRGVQNTDIVHQWDEESHFDNFNQRTPQGRAAFSKGLTTLNQRLERAVALAKGNPQFLDPSFDSFRAIAVDVRNTLAKLVTDKACRKSARCPTASFAARTAALTLNNVPLALVPNPDPHQPTNPDSPFFCCGASGFKRVLGQPPRFFRERMTAVSDAIEFALGVHRGKTLAQTLGANHPLVKALGRDRDAIRAYDAAVEIGHAMHSIEDFFAHTNYVELLTNTAVGSQIPATVDPANGVPLPAGGFESFTETGLRGVLGDARFADLESGAVRTIWLGEGDFCLGDAGVTSVFNPKATFTIGPVDFGPVKLGAITIGTTGRNPAPPPGFRFCHYRTSAAMGLNKDEPGTAEPSHANYPWAAGTATREAALLFKALLQRVAPERVK